MCIFCGAAVHHECESKITTICEEEKWQKAAEKKPYMCETCLLGKCEASHLSKQEITGNYQSFVFKFLFL